MITGFAAGADFTADFFMSGCAAPDFSGVDALTEGFATGFAAAFLLAPSLLAPTLLAPTLLVPALLTPAFVGAALAAAFGATGLATAALFTWAAMLRCPAPACAG
ncbi:MAG: hypothetical protein B7Z78_12285 [Rhodospirillales bacterium 20-60-12]|nr:MAG: hypothetical protein B7Z78_12285 [Rhodospirillales bacterium 20-60-12]